MISAIHMAVFLVAVSSCSSPPTSDKPIRMSPRDARRIDGGTFRGMRIDCFAGAHERPSRGDVELQVSPFKIDRTLVTCAAYADCVRSGSCPLWTPRRESKVHELVYEEQCDEGLAVVHVSSAQRYCAFQGGALPSLAEWQRAVRGQDAWHYPGGVAGEVDEKRVECDEPWSTDPEHPRCLHTSKDGIQYTTRDRAVYEFTRDEGCVGYGNDVAQVAGRAFVHISGTRLDVFSVVRVNDRETSGVFRCAYAP